MSNRQPFNRDLGLLLLASSQLPSCGLACSVFHGVSVICAERLSPVARGALQNVAHEQMVPAQHEAQTNKALVDE